MTPTWQGELLVYGKPRLRFSAGRRNLRRGLLLLLLICAGDVHLNPGPGSPPARTDLCFMCHSQFTRQAKPIPCESCGWWAHSKCTTLTPWEKRQRTNGAKVLWFCGAPACLQPLQIPQSPNNVTVSWSELPLLSPSSPGQASQPALPDPVDPVPVSTRDNPVFMSANVNGLRSKYQQIVATIATYGILIFAVQESKIDSTVSDAELAIPDYTLFRRLYIVSS